MKKYLTLSFNEDLRDRTKRFAVNIIKLVQILPKSEESKIIGRQLLRSATSVAANFRAASRGRSNKEFYSKLFIVVEEADETLFWLELISESGIMHSDKIKELSSECLEIIKIFSKTRKIAKEKLND